MLLIEGSFGIFAFADRDLASFCSSFLVFAFINCGFSVYGVLCDLWVFSNLVFGFRFASTMMTVLPRKPSRASAKTVVSKDH